MIIVLKPKATKADADQLLERIESVGCKPLYLPGTERIVLGAIGDERAIASLHLEGDPRVERVTPILSPYKLVSREFHPHDTLISVGDQTFGGDRFSVIAGPCSVESREQMAASAAAAKAGGAVCLRGGAYKPRTSPYAFQGLGEAGLKILREVGDAEGLPVVTEVIEGSDIETVVRYADILQVGARNMQNYRLLTALGSCGKPVLLKRGMSAEVKELLLAAEYIVSEGNANVILCERGIRTFERATRNTLDLGIVPYLKSRSHLPVFVDPSHGTGVREFVAPMAQAAAACGADGIIVEVHHDPANALSDGEQSLYPHQFVDLMRGLRRIVEATGRTL